MEDKNGQLIEITADIVSAYVSNNSISSTGLIDLIRDVHTALANVGTAASEPEAPALVPAVPIKKSITPDYIISLEDGRKYKSLKRHLRSSYNMSPDEYRAKWGLPSDYPMVAPSYSASRSALAKTMGLGQQRRRAAEDAAEAPAVEEAPRRGRRKAVAAE